MIPASNIRNSTVRQLSWALSMVSVVAGLGLLIEPVLGYKVVALIMLLTVSAAAMLFSMIPVLITAAVSALVWDFLFIPPKFTLSVNSAEDVLFLVMYFIIAMINAVMTTRLRGLEKKALQQREHESAIKLYNTLFNSLSHDLQTPIATIIGATDTIRESKLKPEQQSELITEVSNAALRLHQQVDNLLSLSRIESGLIKIKANWSDIGEICHSVIHHLQPQLQGQKIELSIQDHLPLFRLDAVLIEQVLYNLINNAIVHTPSETLIWVKIEHHSTLEGHFNENIEAQKDHHQSMLTIIVSDNGPGFQKEEIPFVFDKFYRINPAKSLGNGLGLSIAKGFIEAHGGSILLKERPGGGANFTIDLPVDVNYINRLKHE